MTSQNLQLADRPRAAVGMLVRADQHTVYETFADPARATRFGIPTALVAWNPALS
jgi:hypothetical protein